MASSATQQDLPARIEVEAFQPDDETPASACASRPTSSYPFPDFNPPSSRPASSYQPRDPTTTFSLFPKPRTSTPRLRHGSKPPVAFRTRSSSNLLDEFFAQPKRRGPWHDTNTHGTDTHDTDTHDAEMHDAEMHDTDTDELAQRQEIGDMDRQTIRELVDFLRNQAPPPENFMSIPDDPDAEDDRGRWLKLKPFGNHRSRSAPKTSKPLHLPDSAVAGRTIGGHRHIAISIPVEHSPFGLNPTSQYPVYDEGANADPDSVLRFTDSNGMVTVLRTVAESQEYPVTDSSSQKFRRPVSVTHEPLMTPVSRSQSLHDPSHIRDYSTASLPPTPLSHSRSCHLDSRSRGEEAGESRRARSPTCPGSGGTPVSATAGSTPGRRPMPRRWSVFPAGNRGPAESIDGIMYGQRRQPANATASPPIGRAASYSGRPSTSTGASNGGKKTAAKAHAAKVVPKIKVSSGRNSIADWRGQVRDAVAGQGAKGREPLESPPLSGKSTDSRQSRKDKVRQRKKRDIEASRVSWGRKKAGPEDDSLRRSSSTTRSEASRLKADHESDHTGSGSRSTEARGPSVTPVIVVADVKPSPPLTPRGRSTARGFQDRALLTTRTDYNQATLAVRSAVSPGRLQPVSADRAAYEGRLREVEQRMKTLESSGDVWMKSMVPMLDNLNRTLAGLQEERKRVGESEERAKMQEKEKEETPKVVLPMRKLTRRSTINEKMLLDLTRIEKGEVEVIKDGSGLESVMRELQATSRDPSPNETSHRKRETGVAI
ncbi:hypothetical protein IMZ48_44690 [Candidatus Bathyarchaeota archaeon]|nr:hypothetical protein [Candidatus Bathyarchaeota archaeon]